MVILKLWMIGWGGFCYNEKLMGGLESGNVDVASDRRGLILLVLKS